MVIVLRTVARGILGNGRKNRGGRDRWVILRGFVIIVGNDAMVIIAGNVTKMLDMGKGEDEG